MEWSGNLDVKGIKDWWNICIAWSVAFDLSILHTLLIAVRVTTPDCKLPVILSILRIAVKPAACMFSLFCQIFLYVPSTNAIAIQMLFEGHET